MEAGRKPNALTTRKTWAESLEAGITLTRIERQLFLLNRNVERMLNANLRMVSLSVFVQTGSQLTWEDGRIPSAEY